MSPAPRPQEPDPAAAQPGAQRPDVPVERLTYQIILRHLARLRDGARTLLELLDRPSPGPGPDPAEAQSVPAATEQTPLERRIERHMNRVDEALVRIRDLNPEQRPRDELAPAVREVIDRQRRTIQDIVGAELHFWSAAIANAPLDRFDPIERNWIARILRLADRIGVDDDHQEHLRFLKDWAALAQD